MADFKVNYPSTWRVVPAANVPLVPWATCSRSLTAPPIHGSSSGLSRLDPRRAARPARRSHTPHHPAAGGPARGTSFYRYLNLTPQGQNAPESVYTLPTSAGTITAVCSAPTFTMRFTSDCERALATMKLTSGDARSISVDPGYALELNRILGQLNDVRRSAGPGLRSSKIGTRVRAASALAVAHAQAAAAAGHISVGQVSSANQALVTALSQNASAYKALAHAAVKQNVSEYGRAQAAVASAGSGLDAAYSQLRQLGYTIH